MGEYADIQIDKDMRRMFGVGYEGSDRASKPKPANHIPDVGEMVPPTDISKQLREYAADSGHSHNDYADTMLAAASEIERCAARLAASQAQQLQAQQEPVSQWISVKDRLPNSIREVVGSYWDEEIGRWQQIFCCYDADDEDEWLSYGHETPYPIQYWMETSLPPTGGGDQCTATKE